MKILVINGPNMNMLGIREPEIYGTKTLDEINKIIKNYAKDKGVSVDFYQSNHEGDIIDAVQSVAAKYDGGVINPAAYSHYSYAIFDAIRAVNKPFVEVHLSDISAREEFRRTSVTAPACIDMISGEGENGYLSAINRLCSL